MHPIVEIPEFRIKVNDTFSLLNFYIMLHQVLMEC